MQLNRQEKSLLLGISTIGIGLLSSLYYIHHKYAELQVSREAQKTAVEGINKAPGKMLNTNYLQTAASLYRHKNVPAVLALHIVSFLPPKPTPKPELKPIENPVSENLVWHGI